MRQRLEERGEYGNLEALRIIGRALRYLGPFRNRFAIKGGLVILTLLPLLFLPWPVKIIVDHVVLGLALTEPTTPYPALLQPLIHFLDGRSWQEMLFWVVGIQLGLVLLLGAVGTGGAERDQAEGYLSSGHDQATKTENEANAGWSMASGLLGLLDFRFTIRLTQALNHHYRSQLFDRIQTLPMTAFDDERIGDAVYRVMYDTPSITNSVQRIIFTPLGSLTLILVTIFVLQVVFGSHPPIIWTAVAILAISIVATVPFSGVLRRRASMTRKAGATTTSTMEEGLTNILAVQSLGGEGRERARFDRDSWASFGRYRSQMAIGMIITLAALVPGLAIGSYAFYYVADLVIQERISVGDFGLLFSYFLVLTLSCVEVGALWIRVQESSVGLDRVFFLMDLPGETDHPGATTIPRLERSVRIEGVDFSYPDGTPALEGVEFEARVGQVSALVGPAGAGKTTLAYLLPRFILPDRGRVLFDDLDIATATLPSIRDQVAFVFQETVLFDATVEENIRIGNPTASDAEVRRAAHVAGADEFIARLPEGYSTPLGRGGGKLSVGQKQRLVHRAGSRPARSDPDSRRAHVRARLRDGTPSRRGAP